MTATDDAWAKRAGRIALRWLARHAAGMSEADREDVVQDTLVRLLERPEKWHVIQSMIDVLRARSHVDRFEALDDDPPEEEPQPYWFNEEFVERAGLTEKQLRACRLRLDGLTTNEASEVLGITPRAFRMRLRRTKAQVLAAKRFLK